MISWLIVAPFQMFFPTKKSGTLENWKKNFFWVQIENWCLRLHLSGQCLFISAHPLWHASSLSFSHAIQRTAISESLRSNYLHAIKMNFPIGFLLLFWLVFIMSLSGCVFLLLILSIASFLFGDGVCSRARPPTRLQFNHISCICLIHLLHYHYQF